LPHCFATGGPAATDGKQTLLKYEAVIGYGQRSFIEVGVNRGRERGPEPAPSLDIYFIEI
jgi:hypothetical protein